MDGFDEQKAKTIEQRLLELKAMRTSEDTTPGAIMRSFIVKIGPAIDQVVKDAAQRAFVREAYLRSEPPRHRS